MTRNLGPMFDESLRLEYRLQAWRERVDMRRAALYAALAAHVTKRHGDDTAGEREAVLVHEVRELEAEETRLAIATEGSAWRIIGRSLAVRASTIESGDVAECSLVGALS